MATEMPRHKLLCSQCGELYAAGEYQRCPKDDTTLNEIVLEGDPDEDPLVGEVLDGRFEIEDILGEGAMGRVYRATQTSVDRTVAVKTLRPKFSTDEKTIKRFQREARVISDFSHPNIVRLVDFGQDLERGTLYLAMEYVDGYPVREILDRGRVAPELALHLAVQLCGALAEVHSYDLVHRDLKPENLMIVPLTDGRVELKLLDFGIAHVLRESEGLTKTGAVFGTPQYLSPEQAEATEVGPYSDVYSTGIVLFEMLAGIPPVAGETAMQIMVGHVNGRVSKLDEILGRGELSDELVWLVNQMLSKLPAERPDDILHVRDIIKTIASLEDYETPEVDPSVDFETMFEPYILEPGQRSSAKPGDTPATVHAGPAQALGGDSESFVDGPVDSIPPRPESTYGIAGRPRDSHGEPPESIPTETQPPTSTGSSTMPPETSTQLGRSSSDVSEAPVEDELSQLNGSTNRMAFLGLLGVLVLGGVVALNFLGAEPEEREAAGSSGTSTAEEGDERVDGVPGRARRESPSEAPSDDTNGGVRAQTEPAARPDEETRGVEKPGEEGGEERGDEGGTESDSPQGELSAPGDSEEESGWTRVEDAAPSPESDESAPEPSPQTERNKASPQGSSAPRSGPSEEVSPEESSDDESYDPGLFPVE